MRPRATHPAAHTPHHRGHRGHRASPWRRYALAAFVMAAIVALAHLADAWGTANLTSDRLPILESRDWYRLLRVLGYGPTWAVLGVLALIIAAHRRGWGPAHHAEVRSGGSGGGWGGWGGGARAAIADAALLTMLGSALAGGLAEILKLIFRRGRPDAGEPYVFFDFASHGFDTSDYGLPSSHAAVAFGAAFAIALRWRATLLLTLPLALGCGWTRLLAGQHFISDIALAACVGFVAPRLVRAAGRALFGEGGRP
jgi:membrane-associated phospholipid phosphatase